MSEKSTMTVEQNILFAKRNLIDSIWKSANLEGYNVTFPETYAIIEQATLKNIDMAAVVVVNNLKLAWKFVLENIEAPLNCDYLKAIHSELARGIALEWGQLRTGEVGIAGTNYKPPVISEIQLNDGLRDLDLISDPVEHACELCAYLMRSQAFWDGNKRTAMLAANKVLIENGSGLLSIAIDDIETFNERLHEYYENGKKAEFINYLKTNCIETIEFT